MNKLILKTSVLSLSALLLVACGQTKKEQPASSAGCLLPKGLLRSPSTSNRTTASSLSTDFPKKSGRFVRSRIPWLFSDNP